MRFLEEILQRQGNQSGERSNLIAHDKPAQRVVQERKRQNHRRDHSIAKTNRQDQQVTRNTLVISKRARRPSFLELPLRLALEPPLKRKHQQRNQPRDFQSITNEEFQRHISNVVARHRGKLGSKQLHHAARRQLALLDQKAHALNIAENGTEDGDTQKDVEDDEVEVFCRCGADDLRLRSEPFLLGEEEHDLGEESKEEEEGYLGEVRGDRFAYNWDVLD